MSDGNEKAKAEEEEARPGAEAAEAAAGETEEAEGADEEAEGEGEGEEALAEAAAEGGAADAEGEDYVELVKIHNVRDANEAHLVKSILESFHIPCETEDAGMDNFGGILPTQLDGVDVYVPAQFEAKAKAVLCERNIVCGIDKGRLEALLADAGDEVAQDAGKRASLLARIGDETRDYRHEALSAIGKRGGKGGFELLRALLRDALRSDAGATVAMDVAALTNLGAFGRERALLVLDDLDRIAKDPDAGVRKRAATALGRLRGVGAAPALVDLLGDDDAGVRDEALESLYALSQGETFDFDPEMTPASQEQAIARWRAWVRDNPGA
jgi:hypothetical protein